MNKMKMAHDFAMNCLKNPSYADAKTYNIISSAWTYADAMQAEADKREDKAIPDAILNNEKRQQEQTNYHDALVEVGLEEWQPDWSVAPESAIAWEYLGHGGARWVTVAEGWYISAPTFGYDGPMVKRKRPK